MYFLEGARPPGHDTVARFRSLHFVPVARNILAQMTNILADNAEVSFRNIFIEGTKLEAVANKHTFVWKKDVTKNQQKLMEKIPALFQETEKLLGIKIVYGNLIKQHHLKKICEKFEKNQAEEGILFVHGIDKRKSEIFNRSFSNYMHDFNSANCFLSRFKTIKSQHWLDFLFNKQVILLNDIVQILYFPECYFI